MKSEQIDTPETAENLIAALAKVQGSLPSIHKDATGNYGKYVTLDAIHESVLPLLSANGLAWITMPTYDDNGEPVLEYKLMHTSGEKLEGRMRMYVSQPNSQQAGSAITYAKRYAICAVVGVTADEDDDGEAAKTAPAKPYTRAAATATTKPYVAPVSYPAFETLMAELRIALTNAGLTGENASGYCVTVIGKDKPTNSAEVKRLLTALDQAETNAKELQ